MGSGNGEKLATPDLAKMRLQLEKGFASLLRLAKFDPYLAGSHMTYADIFFYFSLAMYQVINILFFAFFISNAFLHRGAFIILNFFFFLDFFFVGMRGMDSIKWIKRMK